MRNALILAILATAIGISFQTASVADANHAGDWVGDVDCNHNVSSVDALKILRHIAGLSVAQEPGCPLIGSQTIGNGELQGNVDCANAVSSVDALKVLRDIAALPVVQAEPCDDIGPLPGTLLYQSNWGTNSSGCPNLFGWQRLGEMCINDGSDSGGSVNWIPAYNPGDDRVLDYAVEAEMQFISVVPQHPSYCSSFGLVARAPSLPGQAGGYGGGAYVDAPGFDCGVDGIISQFVVRRIGGEVLDFLSQGLGNDWLTYRLEVEANNVRLLINGIPLLEAIDNQFLQGGSVGLWSSLAQINVRNLKVVAL